jgi:Tol biopolymer transport system component
MRRAILPAILVAAACTAAPAQAHFGPWSAPARLDAVNSPVRDGCPFQSSDGRRLYIASDREGTIGGLDIWVSERAHPAGPWEPPVNLGPPINSEQDDFCPSPGRGGHFMFVSKRAGGCGLGDIYRTRYSPGHGWPAPRNLGCTINSAAEEAGPVRVRGALYFSSNRSGNYDIFASPAFGPWIGPPQPVKELNTDLDDARPFVRGDGREIVFDSTRTGSRGSDIWTATRPFPWGRWSAPVNLAQVNSDGSETRPSLSPDGRLLYFGSVREGRSQDVFTSTR